MSQSFHCVSRHTRDTHVLRHRLSRQSAGVEGLRATRVPRRFGSRSCAAVNGDESHLRRRRRVHLVERLVWRRRTDVLQRRHCVGQTGQRGVSRHCRIAVVRVCHECRDHSERHENRSADALQFVRLRHTRQQQCVARGGVSSVCLPLCHHYLVAPQRRADAGARDTVSAAVSRCLETQCLRRCLRRCHRRCSFSEKRGRKQQCRASRRHRLNVVSLHLCRDT